MNLFRPIRRSALALAVAGVVTGTVAEEPVLFKGHVVRDAIVFEPASEAVLSSAVDLIVTGPGGFHLRESFKPGALREVGPAVLDIGSMPEGSYNYEIRVVDVGEKRARANDGSAGLAENVDELVGGFGTFTVRDGALVDSGAPEPTNPAGKRDQSLTATGKYSESTRDQVVADDQIVQASLCVGLDCVNGESFGFDTIRLKENNLRIKFQDTSSSGSFPTNDWQITANDSSNGGKNRFSIDDVDGGRTPFTVEAGTPSHSMYLHTTGRIGMGTSTPVTQAHMVDGNTPTLRLDQDGSSGFSPQIWDVAGNETNFFVRDVTNGSKLPFKILPNASTNSLVIEGGGNVGMGVRDANASLHVQRSGGAKILVEDSSGTAAERSLLQLINNGKTRFVLTNTQAGSAWTFDNAGATFDVSRAGTGAAEFSLDESGNATFRGSVTANGVVLSSSRTVKTSIGEVDPDELLEKLLDLPVHSWKYLGAEERPLHVGPMAEDFHAAFGLGGSRHIDLIDTTGITIASIQALATNYRKKVATLERELDVQRERTARLERKLESLARRLENGSR